MITNCPINYIWKNCFLSNLYAIDRVLDPKISRIGALPQNFQLDQHEN